jgi:opacity protein-like surface antigen
MKKTILIATLVFFYCTNIQAQGFSLGIKGGADVLKLSGKSFDDEFAYGYHLGGFAEIKLNKTFGIQPEIYYSSTSMKTSSSLDSIYSNVDVKNIKLGYINIPILLNFKPSKKICFQVGPRYGILSNSSLSVKQNAENAFKSGDFSLLAGIQLNFSKIRVYGRYQIGLTDINDATSQEKWKSQTIHVGVGLKIL